MKYVARCRCGQVELEASGPHLVHISCYCDDCQAAADKIEALPDGWSGRDADGGTLNVLFRRDRIRCVRGEELLIDVRVREGSHTRRLVASCCNTAMTQIHENWWPHRGIKTARIEAPPPLEVRMFTRYAPGAVPDDVPSHPAIPPWMGLRLVRAAVALRLWRGGP